jgi:hypothetical protein
MVSRHLVSLIFHVFLGFASATNTKLDAPRFHLSLTPVFNPQNERLELDISLKFNETLISLHTELASIPTARYETDTLSARDDHGPLVLDLHDAIRTLRIAHEIWKTKRQTYGPVIIDFTAYSRQVNASNYIGPLFDLWSNKAGQMVRPRAIVVVPDIYIFFWR